MAKFFGVKAIGNRAGGFYTNNPASEFHDCVAENNEGPGFLDDSGSSGAPHDGRLRRFGRFLRDTSVATIAAVIGANAKL
jgi:hypothetical protein